jgi:hypothetical protein
MKKLLLLPAFIFLAATAMAQLHSFVVSGMVTDANSNMPLQAASVFAQNTTTGTVTDASGKFTLQLANGGYDLIISFTGYETYNKRISTNDDADKHLLVQLKPKEKSLEEVSIKSNNEVKDGWQQYGNFFTEQFIGKTANSSVCSIKNKEVLKFYFSKKRNRLKVLADEPLLIENPALGYVIKYTLDSFTYDYTNTNSQYAGYPLFEEMATTDEALKSSWVAARKKAYQGSILHFMRSIYQQQLKQNGFEIQFLVKINNADTGIRLGNFYGAINYAKDDSTGIASFMPNQPDMAVLYTTEKPDAAYLLANADAASNFQLSIINITQGELIAIEQNGFYYDQNDMLITGYWAWEKMADMLPYDYRAE